MFGRNYIDHGDFGRFINLVKYNNMTSKGMLTGKEEADAFDNAEYVKLHQSTLLKVDAMSNIVERVVDSSLLTCATWKDKYGFHPKVIVEYVKEHWLWSLIAISAVVIGLAARLQQWF